MPTVRRTRSKSSKRNWGVSRFCARGGRGASSEANTDSLGANVPKDKLYRFVEVRDSSSRAVWCGANVEIGGHIVSNQDGRATYLIRGHQVPLRVANKECLAEGETVFPLG